MNRFRQVFEDFRISLRYLIPFSKIGIGALIVFWLLSGIYVVHSDEEGVVRRFGKVVRQNIPPGIHYHLPWPVEKVDKPKVRAVRRIMVGYNLTETESVITDSIADSLIVKRLTGDINVVNLILLVQFSIKDAYNYLFQTENPEELVRDATEAAITELIGKMTVDDVLTIGKVEIQTLAHELIQKYLDYYKTGLQIVSVNLQSLTPPEKVIDAFRDVISARAEGEKYMSDALAARSVVISEAKSESTRIVKEAEAYKESKINEALGEAYKFLSILQEYREAPEVTKTRMYLEMIDSIGPKINKIVISSKLNEKLMKIYGITK